MTTSPANDATARKFDVQASLIDGVVVLTVHGDLDVLTAPHLTDAICNALDETPTALIVDLSGLDFLGSAGMTALMCGHYGAGNSTRFGVVADGANTRRPMTMIGLDRELGLYPTLAAALKDPH